MSSQDNLMQTILTNKRTVFTVQSLSMLSEWNDNQKLTKSLHYYSQAGKLLNPRRGIYTKLKYDEKEMACCLFRPSYLSLEYVLQRAGIVFQWDNTMTSISYLSREICVNGTNFQFRKIKPEIWMGMEGIEQQDNVLIASAERAFIDMVYLSAGNCYFDNIKPLNISKIRRLLPLYHSAQLAKRIGETLNTKI